MNDYEKLQNNIKVFFEKTPFEIESFEISQNNDGSVWCKVETPDSKHLIGKNGETLQSLAHLIKRMFERDLLGGFTLDINGYQKKHIDNIQSKAHIFAERARYFKGRVEIEPMNSYDRRIVHDHLSQYTDIETTSIGEGRDRRVVVSYIN